ncbi:hypothetical protein BOX15_Mlig003194g1, partial [Macrostomum lignano]
IRAVRLSSSRRLLCSTGTEDYPFLGAAVPPQSDTDGQSASLPSVTTVLDRTRPPESAIALARWLRKKQEALGPEGFARYRAGLLSAGTQLHRSIWSYLESGDAQPEAEVAGFFQSVLPILRTVESVQSQEALVVHQQLGYKGRLDCLARLRPDEGDVNSGRQRPELLIEWKTAHERKIAGLKDAYDAPLQLASYLGALNQMPWHVVMATRIACRQLIRLFWSMPIRTARRPPAFGWASTSCCRPGQPGCTGCVPSSWLRIGRLPS